MNGSYAQPSYKNPAARRLIMDCIEVAKHAGRADIAQKGRDILFKYEGVTYPEASVFS